MPPNRMPRGGTMIPALRAPAAQGPANTTTGERTAIMTTEVGLLLPHDLSYAGWERAGRQLSRVVDFSAWCLGDWLAYGQRCYTDRYHRAVASVGLDYQTLR